LLQLQEKVKKQKRLWRT